MAENSRNSATFARLRTPLNAPSVIYLVLLLLASPLAKAESLSLSHLAGPLYVVTQQVGPASPQTARRRADTRIAVTVDDLPQHGDIPSSKSRMEITRKMLKELRDQSIPEVYGFINAKKLDSDPSLDEILKLWVAAGYPLGNHTYSHASINKVSIDEFRGDIDKNEVALESFGKDFDWRYFRYPFLHEGNTLEKRNAIREYLKTKGYKIAQVTVDFDDWSWNGPYARCMEKRDLKTIEWLKQTFLKNALDKLHRAEEISDVLFHRQISHVLLLHIGAFDAEIIGDLLKLYKEHGVTFIPLSEAVKDEVYSIDPEVTGEWGAEFIYQIMKSRDLKQVDVGLSPYGGYPEEQLGSVCR